MGFHLPEAPLHGGSHLHSNSSFSSYSGLPCLGYQNLPGILFLRLVPFKDIANVL